MYLARDIPAFVMYCVYGESRSSLLIESTDSIIHTFPNMSIDSILIRGLEMGLIITFRADRPRCAVDTIVDVSMVVS